MNSIVVLFAMFAMSMSMMMVMMMRRAPLRTAHVEA